MKFAHEKLETLRYHTVKTRSLYLTWSWIGIRSWQTDRQNYDHALSTQGLKIVAEARVGFLRKGHAASTLRTR